MRTSSLIAGLEGERDDEVIIEPEVVPVAVKATPKVGGVLRVQFVSRKQGFVDAEATILKAAMFNEGGVSMAVYLVDDGKHVGIAVNKADALTMDGGATPDKHLLNEFQADYVAVEHYQYRGGKNNLPKQFIVDKLWKRFARIERAQRGPVSK